jgi:acyl-coenzyme A thioesterase PaaI-like protein
VSDVVFRRQGDTFHPTEAALSPWGSDTIHGGSAAALLAYGIESAKADPALMVARMTIDLFRAVPNAPLRIESQPVRTGRRIQVLTTSLFAGDRECARTTALLLLPSQVELQRNSAFDVERPPGPEGIETTSLMPPERRISVNPGLHTTVQARRVTPFSHGQGGRSIAWLRIPIPFIEGVETTPLMRVAGSSDLGNGLAHIRVNEGMGFINTDISVYLHREARGEWIALDVVSGAEGHGIGLIRGTLFDADGPIGTLTEALLANPRNT